MAPLWTATGGPWSSASATVIPVLGWRAGGWAMLHMGLGATLNVHVQV